MIEALTIDYLAAIEKEEKLTAESREASAAAATAATEALALETQILAEAKGGERFTLRGKLVSIDGGVMSIEPVTNLDLVR